MHVSLNRRQQLFRGDSFSALGRDSCICQWLFLQFKPKETELHPQYQNSFFVRALCPVSPSRQQSSLPGLQAEALHKLINKTPGHFWYLWTTYASNGLENWLSIICTNIKLSLLRLQDQNIQCLHTIKLKVLIHSLSLLFQAACI